DCLAIRPLDPLKLGPYVHQEPDNPTVLPPRAALSLALASPAGRLAAGRFVGQVLLGLEVVLGHDVLVLFGRVVGDGLVSDRALAETQVLGRGADLEVGFLERLGLLLLRGRAVGLLAPLEARRAARRLALLRSLSVACHWPGPAVYAPASA